MAEIGIVASVVQLAGAGLKLSIDLYSFAETVSSAEKDIKHVAKDVSLTSAVLTELGENFKNDGQKGIASDNAIRTAQEVVHECSQLFSEINVALANGCGKGSGKFSLGRLKWPFLKPRMELLRTNLERLKSTLILMLHVLAYATRRRQSTSEARNSDFDRLQIQSLIKANQRAITEFERLSLTTVPPREDTRNEDRQESCTFSRSSTLLGDQMHDDPFFSTMALPSLPAGSIQCLQPTSQASSQYSSNLHARTHDANARPASSPLTHMKLMSSLDAGTLVNWLRNYGAIVDTVEEARTVLIARSMSPSPANMSVPSIQQRAQHAKVAQHKQQQPAQQQQKQQQQQHEQQQQLKMPVPRWKPAQLEKQHLAQMQLMSLENRNKKQLPIPGPGQAAQKIPQTSPVLAAASVVELGKAEGPFAGLEGLAVVKGGKVKDGDGNLVVEIVEGDVSRLVGCEVNEYGGIIDSYGNVSGHAEPLEEAEEMVVPGEATDETCEVEDAADSGRNETHNIMTPRGVKRGRSRSGDLLVPNPNLNHQQPQIQHQHQAPPSRASPQIPNPPARAPSRAENTVQPRDLSSSSENAAQPRFEAGADYQTMTLGTEQGSIQVPIGMKAAGSVGDEKRKRNASASFRFRERREEKEADLAQRLRNAEEKEVAIARRLRSAEEKEAEIARRLKEAEDIIILDRTKSGAVDETSSLLSKPAKTRLVDGQDHHTHTPQPNSVEYHLARAERARHPPSEHTVAPLVAASEKAEGQEFQLRGPDDVLDNFDFDSFLGNSKEFGDFQVTPFGEIEHGVDEVDEILGRWTLLRAELR